MAMKKQENNKISQLRARLNVLFLLVFLLFSALIIRLGMIQIVRGEEYANQSAKQANTTITYTQSAPRGMIYDRHGHVIVGNAPEYAITYTRYGNATTSEMLASAEILASFLEVDISRLTVRDKKDYWLLTHPDEAAGLVSQQEQKQLWEAGGQAGKSKSEIDEEVYQLQLERITEEQLHPLTDHDLQVSAIYSKMASGSVGSTRVMISGNNSMKKEKTITYEEFAAVSEHLSQLPGVDAVVDWNRIYPYGDVLRSVLGNVSTEEEGLPGEKLDYYVARGYSRNDRVGTSYIEEVYEEMLHGTKTKLEVHADNEGNITDYTILYAGEKGNDLVLTLDMMLQEKTEAIVEAQLWNAHAARSTADRAFVVVMDPRTGEILSMVGKRIITNEKIGKKEMQDYALGTFSSAYELGSAVKGATLLTAWETGALSPGDYLFDEKLNIRGTPLKGSYSNMGSINDLTALYRSSNAYMFKAVIAMGGGKYASGQGLNLNSSLLDDMRYYFGQFGLGVLTGIDLPNETEGYIGTGSAAQHPGFALDLAIGQYDTYTPMQLAQYVSTIANGGYRMKPQLLKAVLEPQKDVEDSQRVVEGLSPVVLNKAAMNESWIERVQEGFKAVMHNSLGTGYAYFHDSDYYPAGKTGTAEATVNGQDVENVTLVAYAPYDNPEVAIAVVVPWAEENSPAAKLIGRQVLDVYFTEIK
ncbi:Cell division protein FtsI/penicillin-binding protein 2 [Evansella caseinilytica]|uniref:serine-type D-Ala-D-Ala carboxypeptidase n=1 Tax=Evansella caseinilytica TaxID=1503961 RepID=A0A1H3SPN3_9BACI|nr:penicillin-binding protein 2 [Evansella caseinilytica]SDZ39089.1 Cell division protein FtsI/penicillin-binding protein 2 [Evansella caseinilytica]